MKVASLRFVGVLAAAAALAGRVAALCDFGELPFQLGDVVEPAFKCQTASGYSFVQPSTLPTATQLTAICAQCGAFLSAVAKAKDALPTCALAMDNGSTVTVDKLFQGVAAQCARGSAAPSAGSTGASADGSDAGAGTPTTTAPVISIPTTPPSENLTPTTAAPSPKKSKEKKATTETPIDDTTSGSDDDEDDGQDDVASHDGSMEEELAPARSSAPEATTKAPRPAATKIAASSATAATSTAVLVATAAAVAWALA